MNRVLTVQKETLKVRGCADPAESSISACQEVNQMFAGAKELEVRNEAASTALCHIRTFQTRADHIHDM